MSETIRITLILLCIAALTLCVALYMKPNARYVRSTLKKAGSFFQYGYWKICLNVAYGFWIIKPKLKGLFTHYQSPIQEDQSIRQMQQRLDALKAQMAEDSHSHHVVGTSGYNLKILK